MSAPVIRLARPNELDLVRELEDLAGEINADAGLPPDLPGMSPAEVTQAQADDLLWILADDERAIGFALCWVRPGALHLRELDVHPSEARC